MALSLSQRLGLTLWGAGSDPYTRAQRQAAHETLDDLTAIDQQGPHNSRPAAGVRGRYWTSTDTSNAGRTFRDDGAAWRPLNAPIRVREVVAVAERGQVLPQAETAHIWLPRHIDRPAGHAVSIVGVRAFLHSGSVTFRVSNTLTVGVGNSAPALHADLDNITVTGGAVVTRTPHISLGDGTADLAPYPVLPFVTAASSAYGLAVELLVERLVAQ